MTKNQQIDLIMTDFFYLTQHFSDSFLKVILKNEQKLMNQFC